MADVGEGILVTGFLVEAVKNGADADVRERLPVLAGPRLHMLGRERPPENIAVKPCSVCQPAPVISST